MLDAAMRETKEETGLLNARDFTMVENFERAIEYQLPKAKKFNTRKNVTYFAAELKENAKPVKLSSEHTEFCWANFQKACNMVPESMKSILRQFDEYLESKELEANGKSEENASNIKNEEK